MAMTSLTAQLAASQQEVVNSRTRVHELEVEVSTDHLTKALNRVALDKKLDMLEANAIPFSVIQCDLDFFKVINDTFGHSAGDEVLQVFTARVQNHLKANDQLYRAGGDEFVVILEGTTEPAQVN
ncbi:GGDEF domain-containing protein, partial [bacterium]|nr:GGDEF domain-containing protein [bacterium]